MLADSAHCAMLRLPSGRRLAYSAVGPADGSPVIYCHGAIGSPLGGSALSRIMAELDIRHIAVNRPGIGGSDPAGRRTVRGFAEDVRQLADELSLEQFDVVGVSAGGPYALAVAHELPERVRHVALCSSVAPCCPPHRSRDTEARLRVPLGALARAPRTCAAVGDALLPVLRAHPRLITRVIAAHAARCERGRVTSPDEQSAAISSFLEASAHGVRGMVDDYCVICRGWGFDPALVSSEVHLWHGVRDPLVPIEHALQLAIALSRCRMFFDPDEGHHFFRSRMRTILATLVGRQTYAADHPQHQR